MLAVPGTGLRARRLHAAVAHRPARHHRAFAARVRPRAGEKPTLTPRHLFSAFVLVLAAAAALSPRRRTRTHGSFDFGFEQRVRNENWDNVFDFNGAAEDQSSASRWRNSTRWLS